MSGLRKLVAGAVVAAMMASSATPAMARGYGGFNVGSSWVGNSWGGGGWGGRHRHHDRVDAGDVIGAVAVVGIIAAIASAASKSKQARSYPASDSYPDRQSDTRSDNRQGSISTENAAVDACAAAAEDRGGQTASVRDILDVRASKDGWDVEGTLEQRSDWRDKTAEKHRFTCSVRFGEVDSVNIDGGSVALR